MTRKEIAQRIIGARRRASTEEVRVFAPANIALCKYWGKRDEELNLPVTSSLSVSLGHKGTEVQLSAGAQSEDIRVDGRPLAPESPLHTRLRAHLDLFRPAQESRFRLHIANNIPLGAGLASSASIFAALTRALDRLFGLELDPAALSILARLGSGSACRSIHRGFVEWHVGVADDGMDSFAEPLAGEWPDLRIGIVMVSAAAKAMGSRPAMRQTQRTSKLYESWPLQVANDLIALKEAIREGHFTRLGETAERNALAMHATMISSWPPILYWLPASVESMNKTWALREAGHEVYFTMDAGPNLKLLFEERSAAPAKEAFPEVDVIAPFAAADSR